jgi:hypothetical protein
MIKKLLFAFIGLSLSTSGIAQQGVPNGGFNSWTGIRPNSWVTVNDIVFMGNDTSAYKDVTSYVEGTASIRMKTVKLNTNPFAAYGIPDTVGLAFTGAINFAGPSLTTGFAYTGRPAELVFAHKYAPVGMDTAWATVILQKWNSSSMMHDTIATGLWWTTNTTSTFTYQTIPLFYNPLMINSYPDTAIVLFSSSSYVAPQVGSTLWIDNVGWLGWTALGETSANEAAYAYPNPASDMVNFSAVAAGAAYIEIYDVTGKKITETAVWDRKAELPARHYPAGVYLYSVLDDKRGIIGRGKFSISH